MYSPIMEPIINNNLLHMGSYKDNFDFPYVTVNWHRILSFFTELLYKFSMDE